jgi:F-type H+-transporting ATPase subunit b
MEGVIAALAKLGFDYKLALFTIVNFAILFFLLKKFFFAKIDETLEERQMKIKEGLDNYSKAQEELEKAKVKSDQVIQEAKVEAGKIIEASYKEAQEMSEKLKDQTQKDISTMLDKAKSNISLLEDNMRKDIRIETVGLITSVLEKIFENNIPSEFNKDLIQKTINNIKKD